MSGKKILVVDDEPAIRSLLSCALGAPGVSVFEADGAPKALALASAEAPFDLVVTDVLMPGMDGIELARRLLEDGRARSFLFMSGYCEVPAERLQAFEVASFLGKPFTIPELMSVVRRLLDGAAELSRTRAASLRAPRSRTALRFREDPIEVIRRYRRKSVLLAQRNRELAAATIASARKLAELTRRAAEDRRALADTYHARRPFSLRGDRPGQRALAAPAASAAASSRTPASASTMPFSAARGGAFPVNPQ